MPDSQTDQAFKWVISAFLVFRVTPRRPRAIQLWVWPLHRWYVYPVQPGNRHQDGHVGMSSAGTGPVARADVVGHKQLMPSPGGAIPFMVTFPEHSDLEVLVNIMRPLMLNRFGEFDPSTTRMLNGRASQAAAQHPRTQARALRHRNVSNSRGSIPRDVRKADYAGDGEGAPRDTIQQLRAHASYRPC